MPDKKLTDNEIVKALECCIKVKTLADCKNIGCPALTSQGCYYFLRTDEYCEGVIFIEIIKDALDLINRLQAEVERLKSDVSVSKDAYMSMKDRYEYEKEKVEKAKQKCIGIAKALKTAKAEAYKEFADRLKEKSKQGKGYLGNVYHSVDVAEIDNLLKEMVGDN